jgi:hypothetical protein
MHYHQRNPMVKRPRQTWIGGYDGCDFMGS